MQRNDGQGGVIISCDFCGRDWDPYDQTNAQPMTEGHHGSVICLSCIQKALTDREDAVEPFECTLCLRRHDPGTACWSFDGDQDTDGAASPPGRNPTARACRACIDQAAGVMSKDPDVPWTRPR